MLFAGWFLLGLVVLLALPLDVAFRLERVEAFTGRITIRWMFGLVKVPIAVPRTPRPAAGRAARPEGARERARRRSRRAGRILAALRQTAFRRRVYRLAGQLVRAAHVTRLRLRVRLGLGDPADTGLLFGIVGPLESALAQGLRTVDVRVEPELIDPVLELRAQGRLQLFPLQIVALVVLFALSPPSIRAWRTVRSGHA